MEQPASLHSKPASLKILSNPSSSAFAEVVVFYGHNGL
jgi:hypothetical protein